MNTQGHRSSKEEKACPVGKRKTEEPDWNPRLLISTAHSPGGFPKDFPGRLIQCLCSTCRAPEVSHCTVGSWDWNGHGIPSWGLVRFLFCFSHSSRCAASSVFFFFLTCPHQSPHQSLHSSPRRHSRVTLSFPYPMKFSLE